MQEKVKVVASNFLHQTGIAGLMRRATASRGGLVLALHRVLPLEERACCYDRHLVLSEPAFVSLLHLLLEDYQVVSLEDLLTDPRGSGWRPKVALSFDDGWEDNYRIAFPHLLANQIPATIFACTGLLGTNGVLPEERFARVWAACDARQQLNDLLDDLNHWGMSRRKTAPLQSEKRHWSQQLKRMPLNARLLLLDHVESRYEVPITSRSRFMTWADVRVMVNTGLVTMGSHTSRHASLTSETDRDIRRELETSKAALMEQTGAMPEILAYPNGMYNRRVIELVRAAGFKNALATDSGTVKKKSNPLIVPRIAVDDTTVTDSRSRLSPARTSVYFLSSGLRPAT